MSRRRLNRLCAIVIFLKPVGTSCAWVLILQLAVRSWRPQLKLSISSILAQLSHEAVVASVRSVPRLEQAVGFQGPVAREPENLLQRMMLALTGGRQQQAAFRRLMESEQDAPSPSYREWLTLRGFAAIRAFWIPYRLQYVVVIRPMHRTLWHFPLATPSLFALISL